MLTLIYTVPNECIRTHIDRGCTLIHNQNLGVAQDRSAET
jgi:hypothetical protein